MDTATHVAADRSRPQLRAVEDAQSLKVSATYGLSEAGRKASLLSGGDGRGRQQLTIQVPPSRLHLVSVDPSGVARLKLQPRYELTNAERVIRHDGPPAYDEPPTIDDLYRDAARNHELERLFVAQRQAWRGQKREADRERRANAAREFLSNPGQRAIVHPAPTPKRCFVQTSEGRVMFDVTSDSGLAKEVPPEAYKRFRTDVHARRQRSLRERAEQTDLHAEKKAFAADWVSRRGTADQKARAEAGVLALPEIVESMTEEAFSVVTDVPVYERDGAVALRDHLRTVSGDASIVVPPTDLDVVSRDAPAATADQWDVVLKLQSQVPDAVLKLREHQLGSRRYPEADRLSVFGVLATLRVGPFNLRREFAAPGR